MAGEIALVLVGLVIAALLLKVWYDKGIGP
jgi:hypothetical protein